MKLYSASLIVFLFLVKETLYSLWFKYISYILRFIHGCFFFLIMMIDKMINYLGVFLLQIMCMKVIIDSFKLHGAKPLLSYRLFKLVVLC